MYPLGVGEKGGIWGVSDCFWLLMGGLSQRVPMGQPRGGIWGKNLGGGGQSPYPKRERVNEKRKQGGISVT